MLVKSSMKIRVVYYLRIRLNRFLRILVILIGLIFKYVIINMALR